MKSVFITFDEAHYEKITDVLEDNDCHGYSYWEHLMGQGTNGGEPHFGSHAWPSMNSGIIAIVEDEKVDNLLEDLKEIDENRPQLGLRAFVWNIEKCI
ncbi:MAG: hypothetical protein KBT32_04950 [Bacteroidales bacterium]|nr:hypothetical protein [Candidatus Physcocola equi]